MDIFLSYFPQNQTPIRQFFAILWTDQQLQDLYSWGILTLGGVNEQSEARNVLFCLQEPPHVVGAVSCILRPSHESAMKYKIQFRVHSSITPISVIHPSIGCDAVQNPQFQVKSNFDSTKLLDHLLISYNNSPNFSFVAGKLSTNLNQNLEKINEN